jgi:hypothetical protein
MKCAPWVLTFAVAACSGDRPPPEPPPDPTEPFEDPVTSVSGTTGPIMQNPPAMVAKSTETSASSGGMPGSASSGTLGTSNSTTHGHPHADQVPIPHGPVGVGGMGATTGTLGNTVTGLPHRGVTTEGSIR